jgi:hypothetical protein
MVNHWLQDDSAMSQEQQSALKHLLVESSCLIAREAAAFRASHPEMTLEWDLRIKGREHEREWLGRMANTEETVRA